MWVLEGEGEGRCSGSVILLRLLRQACVADGLFAAEVWQRCCPSRVHGVESACGTERCARTEVCGAMAVATLAAAPVALPYGYMYGHSYAENAPMATARE